MTKFQKQMLTIAAAGALTAVTALPAMAFENEFHGLFQFKAFVSNFDQGTSGTVSPIARYNKSANNYMDQRTRIQYIAKASDDLKLVTHFEMNTRWGGQATTVANTNLATSTTSFDTNGGDLDTDGLNVLTKHAYLDFNIGKSLNTKVGLMPYKDSLKGVFFDADAPAVYTTYKQGAYTLGLGFTRIDDKSGTPGVTRLGALNTDLYLIDNSYALNKNTSVGMSYYYLGSGATPRQDIKIHTIGLNGQTKMGALELSGFAAMQMGKQAHTIGTSTYTASQDHSTNYHGYAFNVAAKMKVGSGAARATGLFLSGANGTNNQQRSGWYSTAVTSYNEGMTMLLIRNTATGGTSTDNQVVGRDKMTNIALATVGYDANLTEKLFLNSTAAFAWAPKSDDAARGTHVDSKTGSNNASDFMGTELNTELGYKLYKNLTLKAQAAYMILGGYYKNAATNSTATDAKSPNNPYTMRMQATYTF